jgi:hypothetical protein
MNDPIVPPTPRLPPSERLKTGADSSDGVITSGARRVFRPTGQELVPTEKDERELIPTGRLPNYQSGSFFN